MRSPSNRPEMADRGGSRRDGFGSSRDGRGLGRTSARTNVWQRIDGRDSQRGHARPEGATQSDGDGFGGGDDS